MLFAQMRSTVDRTVVDRTVFGHPIGLVNLFGVELWERFSFYGMLGMLGYYLYYSLTAGGLGLSRPTAAGIVGAYGGLMYLSTVVGGWVADRVLGMERTVFFGGVVMMCGHVALAALPGATGLLVGLPSIALGSGGVKANASSLLGSLYRDNDPRIDGGFTLFYLGVNAGAFVGPLVTGVLQQRLGFHYGFGAAAVGMALGLIQYALGRANMVGRGRNVPNPPNPLSRGAARKLLLAAVTATGVISTAVATGLVTLSNLSWTCTGVLVVVAVAYFTVFLGSPDVTATERIRVRAFIPLFLANVVFWSLFQQMFTVLAVYSDRRMNWSIFGWHAPASWIGSLEPIWVVVLSPLFAALWTSLGERAPATPRKFAYGVIGMGAAFMLFVPLTEFPGRSVPAPVVFAILAAFAVSELLLSPIGLAVTTHLAPRAFRSQMMALNFVSVGIGTALSGALARYYTPDREVAYFGITGTFAIVIGIVVRMLAPRIGRLMIGIR